MDKKQFYVMGTLSKSTLFDKYEDAEAYAKRLVSPTHGYTKPYILETLAFVQAPLPAAEVTKLT